MQIRFLADVQSKLQHEIDYYLCITPIFGQYVMNISGFLENCAGRPYHSLLGANDSCQRKGRVDHEV